MIEQQYNGDSQDFADACLEWDIERLVKDLEGFEKRPLTPAEKRNLQAILLGLSASQAQDRMKVAKKTRSLDGYFNKIRRIVELFLDLESSTLKTSHDVVNALASYRKGQELPPPKPEFDLLGRDTDRQKLAELSQKHKLVLLKAAAGIGKSTLARHFLETQFTKVIRLEMGMEAGNVTPAEEKVSQILRKEFDEEPSRDFQTNLEILREKLSDKSSPIGVLIDNLEPSLDANFRFLEKSRGYEDLLRILGDRDVCSFTLITSRKPLIVQRVKVHEYSLKGLDIVAWREYFHDCKNGTTSEDLAQMCVAYNGNAKAMGILHGAIINRFDSNIAAYWNRYKDSLLADAELETLISMEMDWLRDNQPDAYKLLCRMGCYRYQDVKTVPFEGLICLLWDVPEDRKAYVVNHLSKSSLIEFKGEYYLHPAVRQSTKLHLENDKMNWENTNIKIACFFKSKISKIKTVEDALLGFEIIYHYLEINDYEKSASVIFELKNNDEDDFDNFGFACWRLGFSQQIIWVISKILDFSNIIRDVYVVAGLYRILGYAKNQLGNIHEGIKYHKISGDISKNYCENISLEHINSYDYRMVGMLCSYFSNVGLCYYDLWEIEKASKYFQTGIELTEYFNRYWVEDNCCLALTASSFVCSALTKSFLGFYEQSEEMAKKLYKNYQDGMPMSAWGRIYVPFLLGKTYKNLGNIQRAFEMYQLALSLAKENQYKQAIANILSSFAEVYRELKEFDLAYSHHYDAIETLYCLGAKCDLAEAYFQLGLTYHAMGENDQVETYKAKALELFEQMEAPKQIERVNQAFEQGAKK